MVRRIRTAVGEPIQRPSWLVPLILLGITGLLAVAILVWYLAPSLEDLFGGADMPTADVGVVELSLGERRFAIPANYIRRPEARAGGAMTIIELDALLPDMHGFTAADTEAMRDVTRNSPVVTITLEAKAPEFAEGERFDRIYARNADPARPPYPYAGFTAHPMAPDSGYAGQQVFTREIDGAMIVVVCTDDDTEQEIGGLCLREMAWGDGLTLTYGFRGGHLQEWADVDKAVTSLLTRLEVKPSP